jgi:hypothetical protein
LWRFPAGLKPEGVCIASAGPTLELLVCTDTDDADLPALLLQVSIDAADLRKVYFR